MFILNPICFLCHLEEQIATRKHSFESSKYSLFSYIGLYMLFFEIDLGYIFITLGWIRIQSLEVVH